MDNDFLTSDYKLPVTSNYMKFMDGDNSFRVLSSAVTGYEVWDTSNKPIRSAEPFDDFPATAKVNKDGNVEIKHFWAFAVYNYEAKRIQILELTQKGIMKYMQGLIKNPKWGSPKGYDITVTRSGSGFDTEYTTVASPHSVVDPEILEKYSKMKIDLSALFESLDPFKVN